MSHSSGILFYRLTACHEGSNKICDFFFNKHFIIVNYVFNAPTKCTYNKMHVLIITFSPTCFSPYCSIFRENFFVCSKYCYIL
jgi:hypothetical protein